MTPQSTGLSFHTHNRVMGSSLPSDRNTKSVGIISTLQLDLFVVHQVHTLRLSNGLEIIEARIVDHEKDEAVYEENIQILKYDVQVKDISIKDLKNQLEEALKEKDDLKLKLEKFEESSKNLAKLINSQISAKDKTSLGYDGQMNESELNNIHMNESKVVHNEYVFKSAVRKTTTSVPETENSISKTSKDIVEKHKTVRPSALIIEEWDTNNDNDINAAKQSSPRVAKSISTAKLVNTASPKPKVNDALPTTYSYFQAHSPVKKPINKRTAVTDINFNKKINTAKVNNVTTAGPKEIVSAAEGNGENNVKSSECWIWRPTGNDQGIFDSGCSKHMTGNKSFLTDYQEVDGGFVVFTGSPKGGKIRTGKLDFEDVYFVKELKFNLFSVSQMRDKKNNVLFTKTECLVLSLDFKLLDERGLTCLFAKATTDESNLWHRRLGHINFKTMNKLVKGNLVRGLPSKLFENNHTCVACQKGKQHKASCKTKLVSSISQPLQMLHMDLFGPTSVRSINHKIYCLVVTDDYSRMKGIKREFRVARNPQQNRVSKRKNRTLIEAARTMLADSLLPTTFWAKAVSTACYVHNRVLVTKPCNKTPYELLHGRPPSISFMRPFGCPVTILNTLDPLGKFDGKADTGFFVGYSINSKAFKVFNTRTRKVEENLHITFLENKPNVAGNGPDWLVDIDLLTNSMNYEPVTTGNQTNKNAGIKDNVDAVPTHQYILLPLLYNSLQSSKDAVADDASKKTNEEPVNEGERNGQEKEGGASNKEDDQNVQFACSTEERLC
ncbi:ribonuclease H-like domain-containing protein [Tanacetum coccineum]